MRPEYKTIIDWVEKGSNVIDLGCGDYELLRLLDVSGEGMDKRYGSLIDKKENYANIKDKQFDYAICNATLQMVEYPEVLLSEMKRISKKQIISFPNFAKWNNRLELLFKGRMPRRMLCGYEWYSTGHLHQLSIKDFISYVGKDKILRKEFLPNRPFPNLTAHTAIYLCEL